MWGDLEGDTAEMRGRSHVELDGDREEVHQEVDEGGDRIPDVGGDLPRGDTCDEIACTHVACMHKGSPCPTPRTVGSPAGRLDLCK